MKKAKEEFVVTTQIDNKVQFDNGSDTFPPKKNTLSLQN